LLVDWYMITGRHRSALPHYEALVGLGGPRKHDDREALIRAFARFPDQTVVAFHPSTIRCHRKGPVIWVPITINGITASYLLDTGAGLSMVNESSARRVGLKVFEVEPTNAIDFANQRATITKLAVAERLDIGRIR